MWKIKIELKLMLSDSKSQEIKFESLMIISSPNTDNKAIPWTTWTNPQIKKSFRKGFYATSAQTYYPLLSSRSFRKNSLLKITLVIACSQKSVLELTSTLSHCNVKRLYTALMLTLSQSFCSILSLQSPSQLLFPNTVEHVLNMSRDQKIAPSDDFNPLQCKIEV